MRGAGRVLGYLLAFLAGAAATLRGCFAYGYSANGVPVGMAVALGLCFAVFVTAGLVLRSRGAAGVAALGWFVAVVVFAFEGPGGDLVVPSTSVGLVWLFGSTLVAGVSLAFPYGAAGPSGRATSGR